jgi:hypothetical protein
MTTPELIESKAVLPPRPAPRKTLAAFNELLTQPLGMVRRDSAAGLRAPGRLFAGALLCYVLYGVAAGCFAGGSAVLLAAAKAPLVIGCTLLLCLPSLFVFGAMAGIEWTWRRLLVLASGFAGSLGMLLLGLLPIAWLFSVSSRYLVTAVWLHILLWLVALVFGWRFLRAALRELGARGAMLPWLLLFCLVSFQVATVLRPVLSREPGEPLFSGAKMSLFENLGRAFDLDDKHEKERKTAASSAPRTR